jgi:hypothetical protein
MLARRPETLRLFLPSPFRKSLEEPAMTATQTGTVTPDTSADSASNRPVRLPRRQRVAAAIASCVVSSLLLGGVLFAMASSADTPMLIAGAAVTQNRA